MTILSGIDEFGRVPQVHQSVPGPRKMGEASPPFIEIFEKKVGAPPHLSVPGTLGRTWGTRPGGWAGEEARDLSPNLRMILAQPASPATKAGCPIQARFWLEWDTTALDVLFFVIRKTKWEPRIHAAATWNK